MKYNTIVLMFMCSALFLQCNEINAAVNYEDIQALNVSCAPTDRCQPSKSDRLMTDWSNRNCFCDEQCAVYSDCCVDAKTNNNIQKGQFECVQMKQFNSVYIMKRQCPNDWKDRSIRKQCELEQPTVRDLLTSLPVTSVSTGITYRNIHCAVCNRNYDSHDIRVWQPRVECPAINSDRDISEARRNFNRSFGFDEDKGEWGIRLENGIWSSCTIDPVLPETVTDVVRRCITSINSCHSNWTSDVIENNCHSYTAHLYVHPTFGTAGKAYKNVHCAICNYEELEDLHCSQALTFRSNFGPVPGFDEFTPFSFAVLLDFRSGYYDEDLTCEDSELYDPFFKKCRNVVCGDEKLFIDGDCVAFNSNSTENLNTTESVFPHCPLFQLEADEYDSDNGSVYVPIYEQRFYQGEYDIGNDSKMIICIDKIKLPSKIGTVLGYVTFFGLTISIICLILHLLAFAALPELRNLSGKNLASLCVALLIAYASHITSNWEEPPTDFCSVIAIVTYYFFLATFFWMQAMAFDVWRTLHRATSELYLANGRQLLRFFIYSCWAWGVPGIIVGIALLVEYGKFDSIPLEFRPMFGRKICWFGQRTALVTFFAAPLAFTKISNIIFFLDSARLLLAASQGPAKAIRCGPERRNFKLYVRMGIIMGLTWVAGLLATILNQQIIWYFFVVLNTLQGLFIFLAFTCTKKVGHALKERFHCGRGGLQKEKHRYASWSWSGGTSATSERNQIQRTKLENHREMVSNISKDSQVSHTFLSENSNSPSQVM